MLTDLAHCTTTNAVRQLNASETSSADISGLTFVKSLVGEYPDIVSIREAAMDVFLVNCVHYSPKDQAGNADC